MKKIVTCCNREYFAKGLCKRHYAKEHYRKYHPKKFESDSDRFFHYVSKTGDCWLWTGGISHKGYGLFRLRGTHVAAHRYSYEKTVGEIPKGLQLDHLCRVRHCVNPSHLEAVTARENVIRGGIVKNKASKLPLGVAKNHDRYMANKCINGVVYYLGTFDTPTEAHIAYLEKVVS